MEFRTLRAFVEVARQGGFSQASKTLFATQSTVSKAVKQLEDEIGVLLFDRIGHRTTLTAAGEIALPRAVRLLAERADLMAELSELRGLQRGRLKLGLPPVGSSTLFAPLVADYRNRYPGIDIQLVEHGGAQLKEELRSGHIELAASLLPVSDEFDWIEVAREPIVALLPAGHPLARRKSVGIELLQEHPFILFEEGFALNLIILEASRRKGFEPVVATRSAQIDFIVELVAAGLGIAFLPEMIARKSLNRLVKPVVLTDEGAIWHLAMLWRRGGFLSLAAQAWLDLVKANPARGSNSPMST